MTDDSSLRIGVLAFHGDVIEHVNALEQASEKLKLNVSIAEVRTKEDLEELVGLIIPGGESTTLFKLCEREGMVEGMQKIPAIFGTCAGAIILAKNVLHKGKDQKTLGLMNIEVERNAYGRQTESFEEKLETVLGELETIYIRAPRIVKIGKNVRIIAKRNEEVLACEEIIGKSYYLAACFHPELTTSLFHEYFLKRISG